MRMTLLGASGPTGRLMLRQAVDAGHDVTALVRTEPAVPPSLGKRVTLVVGDATQVDDLARVADGADAIISALGPGSDRRSTVASRSARAIVASTAQARFSRVVVLSALGSGVTAPDTGIVPKLFGRLLLSAVFADKAAADDVLRHSDLDWTLVRPSILTNGRLTGRIEGIAPGSATVGDSISRADVAAFLLRTAETGEWSRRDVVLRRRSTR